MGQRDDRPVVTSALVAAFFRCFCRIMLASDATRVDATSWHLTQHCPVTTVLACGVRSVTAIAVPLYPDRHPLRRPLSARDVWPLASARFGFPGRWHTCRCGDLHSPQPAFSRRCEPVAGAVREHLRMPPMRPLGASGFAGIAVFTCPRNRPATIRPRRQPRAAGLLAQLSVDAQRCLVQVEALQAGRRGRQRGPAVWALARPPRLTQRHEHLGADDAHITLKVPQLILPGPDTHAPATAGDPPGSRRRSAASPDRHVPAGTGPPPRAPAPRATRSSATAARLTG